VPHILRSVFCFMLLHVQLQQPVARAQTKTSYKLAYSTSWHNSILLLKIKNI